MSFAAAFELVTYLLLGSGLAALVTAGAVEPVLGAACLAVLLLGWRLGPFRSPPRYAHFLLLTFCFLLFGIDSLLGESIVDAAVRLLLLLSLYKSAFRKTDTDYLILFLLAFSYLLVASAYTVSISYLVLLVLYVFMAVMAFVLLECRGAFLQAPSAGFSLMAFLRVAIAITLATLILAVPIFLAIPRGSLGLLQARGGRVSGFSTSVRLGDLGPLLLSPQVVMRVYVNQDPNSVPFGLKWRGIALERFEGHSWSSGRGESELYAPDERGAYLIAHHYSDRPLLEQTFFLEPFSEFIFGAPELVQVSGFKDRRIHLLVDANGTVRMRPLAGSALRYYVHSDLQDRREKIRRIDGSQKLRVEDFREYLELPELNPAIERLSQRLTSQLDSSIGKGLYLEDFLRRNYGYTLEDPSGNTVDPLAHFLLESRAGHCEYFATSLAVMMRVEGIPSRVVNGFRSGEYNPWGEYYIVRQSDAHSWVEAYFPGGGWIEFDPTPSSQAGSVPLARLVTFLLDSLDVLWAEIVTFDRLKQYGFFQSVRQGIHSRLERASNQLEQVFRWRWPDLSDFGPWVLRHLGWLLGGIGACFLCLQVFRRRRRLRLFWKRHVLGESSLLIAQEYYRELASILSRKGFVRKRGETPMEFCRRASELLGTMIPLEVAEVYYRIRFGGHELAETDLNRISVSLASLRGWKS